MSKRRQLLTRLEARAKEDAEDWALEHVWRTAAAWVWGTLEMRLELLPPIRSKRAYYGQPGSLRNPHHSKPKT